MVNKEVLISRRNFCVLSAGVLAGGLSSLISCMVNPVTGGKEFSLVTEGMEKEMDKEYAPHQLSLDYGACQDSKLNRYLNFVGIDIASKTHRLNMPYNFRCVNASHINAYAFPAGSIAVTRGILLELESEAELAGLLGHELGHVNARHTAEQMTKSLLVSVPLAVAAEALERKNKKWADIAAMTGMIGGSLLLARYSRDNEREADGLGLEYMVRAGYKPEGFVGLMSMLRRNSKEKPSALELMFSTHPYSEERYQNAVQNVERFYKGREGKENKERFMDNTFELRKIKEAIGDMQKGDKEMVGGNFVMAEEWFKSALKTAGNDYAALLSMAKCYFAQRKFSSSETFAERAKEVYPQEAQGYYVSGMAKIGLGNFYNAYEEFCRYDRILEGNPTITFLKGYSLEGMNKREDAARNYLAYLQDVREGEYAEHAYKRLEEWGYIKK